MMRNSIRWGRTVGSITTLVLLALMAACAPGGTAAPPPPTAEPIAGAAVTTEPTSPPPAVSTSPPATAEAPAAPTDAPPLPTPIPTITPRPTITPSPTPDHSIACSQRVPSNELLTIVTLTYGLSRDFEPEGLVNLSDYLPQEVTLGYPTQLRRLAVGPLVEMIHDMQAEGLRPFIISGYRSYSAQAIARQKWFELEPERAGILSAPPGHSEHQLGTVVDFGSPELADIVGQEDIEFHTYFYKTSEGIWLLENAHKYGFTLSYPFEAFEITGFFYEPWHWRFVGVRMATFLRDEGLSLTEYQLATEPPPCVPDNK